MKYDNKWVIGRYNNNQDLEFILFWGHTNKNEGVNFTCFSQWYDVGFTHGDFYFKTAEHYMMCEKALLFNDSKIFKDVLESTTPKEAKMLGRHVKDFDPHIWDRYKYNIVLNGNLLKFAQNPEMLDYLLSTEDKILVEASPYDRIWGVGLNRDDKNIKNPNKWQGQNLLGYVLMDVRDRLSKSV